MLRSLASFTALSLASSGLLLTGATSAHAGVCSGSTYVFDWAQEKNPKNKVSHARVTTTCRDGRAYMSGWVSDRLGDSRSAYVGYQSPDGLAGVAKDDNGAHNGDVHFSGREIQTSATKICVWSWSSQGGYSSINCKAA